MPAQDPPAEGGIEIVLALWRDLDRDGMRDDGEPPVEGVVVSDQVAVVRTGANGRATFRSRPDQTRYCKASVPEDCSLHGRSWVRIPWPGPGEASRGPVEVAIGLVPLTAEEGGAATVGHGHSFRPRASTQPRPRTLKCSAWTWRRSAA